MIEFSTHSHCPDCFHTPRPDPVCRHCGFDRRHYQDSASHLSPFTELAQGRYVVGRVLGRPGGFGVVYAGWHTGLHSAVAIKEFFPGLLGVADRSRNGLQVTSRPGQQLTFERWQRRFLREARLLARFRNKPHIVTAFDVFQANGTAYLVMERLIGQSLSDYLGVIESTSDAEIITQHRLTTKQGEVVLEGLLTALEELHARQVYHRDLTPNNVFFLEDNPERLKLLDFGLASSGENLSRGMTSVGVGTPGFAAPEQLAVDGEITPATDFYGLGATLYTALAGVMPPNVEARRMGKPLIPLAQRVPAMAPHLAALIDDCLALQARHRPQSVAEIRSRLVHSTLWPVEVVSGGPGNGVANTASTTLLPFDPPLGSLPDDDTAAVPAAVRSVPSQPMPSRRKPLQAELGMLIMTLLLGVLLMAGGIYLSRDDRDGTMESGQQKPEVEQTAAGDQRIFRDTLRSGGQGPEMVAIPPGWFQMGDIRGSGNYQERPVHWVEISKPFAVGKYEVTVGEYLRFVEATGRYPPEWLKRDSADNIHTGSNDYYRKLGDALTDRRHPIVGISWYDATAYARWLSQQTGLHYRLPTEMEWEYVARAGTAMNYWWGDTMGHNQANCKGCGSPWDGKQTAPVGYFAANPFGIYDTVGNVAEWTCSPWEETYRGQERSCPDQTYTGRRTIRGGAWDAAPYWGRAAARYGAKPDYQNDNLGFRLVRDL